MAWTTCIVSCWLLGQLRTGVPPQSPPRYPTDNRYAQPAAPLEAGAPATNYPGTQPPATPNGAPPANAPAGSGAPRVLLGEPEEDTAGGRPARQEFPARERWPQQQLQQQQQQQPVRQEPPRQSPAYQEPPRQERREAAGAEGRAGRNNAAGLLASMLELPDELKPAGRPVALVEVLSTTSDRQQQLELTQAYWKLSIATAQYFVAWQESQALEKLAEAAAVRPTQPDTHGDRMSVQLALDAAKRRQHDTAQKLLTAQYELYQRMHLPSSAPFPLPADKPHTGTYITYFQQIYSAQSVPPQPRIIDRILPMRLAVIESRGAAVQAARDLFDSSDVNYQQGREQLATVLADVQRLHREHRVFLQSVLQYNDDIASYALNIPRTNLGPAEVVGMLIKREGVNSPPVGLQPSAMAQPPQEVQPAAHHEPVPEKAPQARPPQALAGRGQEPTLAPPRGSHAPPAEHDSAEGTAKQASAEAPVVEPSGPTDFGPREAQKPAVGENAPRTLEQMGLYTGLVDVSPAKRAQELANILHWERGLPEEMGTRIRLEECLTAVPQNERRAVVGGYWRTRENIAQYQALAVELEQIETLTPVVLRMRQAAGGPEAMLRLRLARFSLQSQQTETQIALTINQFQLTQLVHRSLDGPWLLPTTTPHGGGYHLKKDAQPAALADSFTFRRGVLVVPSTHATLIELARTVVLADAARAATAARFDQGAVGLDKLVSAIEMETDQTRQFLATLTQYNLEIADYALAVMPASTPVATVVGALVTPGEGRR